MPPNPKCIVCSSKPQVFVKIDTKRVTVKQFRDDVLIKSLNMLDPDVIAEAKGSIVISSEEGETDGNNDKLLSDLDIVDGCILKVDDFFQNYELTVVILHKDLEREGDLFEINADPELLKATEKVEPEPAKEEQDNGEPKPKKARIVTTADSDDDLCLIEDDDDAGTASTSQAAVPMDTSASPSRKQPIEVAADQPSGSGNGAGPSSSLKRVRSAVADDDDDDVILVED